MSYSPNVPLFRIIDIHNEGMTSQKRTRLLISFTPRPDLMSTNFSRYKPVSSESERARQIMKIEALLSIDTGHGDELTAFMSEDVKLKPCYLKAVRTVLAQGKWRAKLDPLAFIRRTAQSGAIAQYVGNNSEQKPVRAHTGGAIDPKPKNIAGPLCVLVRNANNVLEPKVMAGPEALDETLLFRPSVRYRNVNAGLVGDLKVSEPKEGEIELKMAAAGNHEAAMDYFSSKYRDDDEDNWVSQAAVRAIANDVLLARDGEEEENFDWQHVPKQVDWDAVADKAGFDSEERQILLFIKDGVSREAAIAGQKSQKGKLAVQAAWRRVNRKWGKVEDALTLNPRHEEQSPVPSNVPQECFIPPSEVLRRLGERGLHESKLGAPGGPAWLPVFTDFHR
jgi:hypothetical protein